ncbi:hypothetical protein [Brevibacillus laterosporus]|uniref:hypothetical protein n=1 Tax=Brevibacillus laterosporus TaxID=1465 RepID=UPI003D1E6B34
MGAFGGNISLGGDIDRVGKIGALPHPQFPNKTVPKVKGIWIDVPPNIGVYSKIITADKDVEFINASLAASGYLHPDYWEFTIGNYKLFETIYTKELPQTIYSGTMMSMVYPVVKDTPFRIDFINNSGTSKQVWIDLKLLVSPVDAETLILNDISV